MVNGRVLGVSSVPRLGVKSNPPTRLALLLLSDGGLLIIPANADKYGLPRPELIRSDNALYGRHFRVMEMYDCIVTDPPYGIR